MLSNFFRPLKMVKRVFDLDEVKIKFVLLSSSFLDWKINN